MGPLLRYCAKRYARLPGTCCQPCAMINVASSIENVYGAFLPREPLAKIRGSVYFVCLRAVIIGPKKISPYVPKSSVVLSRYFFIVNMFLAAPANSGIWCFFFFAMSIIYHRLFSTSVPHFSAHHFTFFIGTPRLACHQLRVA